MEERLRASEVRQIEQGLEAVLEEWLDLSEDLPEALVEEPVPAEVLHMMSKAATAVLEGFVIARRMRS